jgi:hypothetical protein
VISLVILAAGIYYGIHFGGPWLRYYQLLDEMRVSARLAPTLSDGVIRRRLEQKVDELEIPAEAKKFQITRSGKPRKIVISTEYHETVAAFLIGHTFLFTPMAEEPL